MSISQKSGFFVKKSGFFEFSHSTAMFLKVTFLKKKNDEKRLFWAVFQKKRGFFLQDKKTKKGCLYRHTIKKECFFFKKVTKAESLLDQFWSA